MDTLVKKLSLFFRVSLNVQISKLDTNRSAFILLPYRSIIKHQRIIALLHSCLSYLSPLPCHKLFYIVTVTLNSKIYCNSSIFGLSSAKRCRSSIPAQQADVCPISYVFFFLTLRCFLFSLFIHRNFAQSSAQFVCYLMMGNESSCALLSVPCGVPLCDNSIDRSDWQNICLISISQQGPNFY